MFIPDTFAVAFPCILVCLFFWGTWSNAVKEFKHEFPLFYWSFSFTAWASSIFYALVFGAGFMPPLYGQSVVANLADNVNTASILYALAAGIVFNIGNILLVCAIAIAGLSVAFPIVIGTALVLGTVFTYAVQPSGNAILLFVGVGLAMCAIMADSVMHREVSNAAKPKPTDLEPLVEPAHVKPKVSQARSLTICMLGGVCMGAWSPLDTLAQASAHHGMSPYGSFMGLCTGAWLCSIFVVPCLMRWPLAGKPCTFQEFRNLPWRQHMCGIAAGFMWSLGTVMNIVSGKAVGFAVSYAAGCGGTMVAALWGLYYGELKGATRKAWIYFVLMVVLYVSAVSVIGISHSA